MDAKILFLETQLKELSEGAQNDSKSSAGDKHETARAMMQLEQEKTGKQLQEANLQKGELDRINKDFKSNCISAGSLVGTNNGFLFLAIGLGKIVVDEISIMVLSPKSPLGHILLGKMKNEKVEINGMTYEIVEIG